MKIIRRKKINIIKTILSLIIIQSLLYFIAKSTPLQYHIVNIDFDQKVPFISCFVYPYVFWYLMLFFIPYLYAKSDEFYYKIYIKTVLIALLVSFIIFIFYPTTLIRDEIIVTNLSTYIINLIYKVDTPAINCLPSMHCLISFLHIFITPNIKKVSILTKVFIIIMSILIILSTVFIKQHVVLDVISALILGLLIYIPTYFYAKKNLSSAKS